MQMPEAGVSGYLASAALESEEADWEGLWPGPAGGSLQNWMLGDSGTFLDSRTPPGAGKSHWQAGAGPL